MKRAVAYIASLGLAVSLNACGVSEEEYHQAVNENKAIQTQLEEMQEENRILNEAILEAYKERESLNERLDDCRNPTNGTAQTGDQGPAEYYTVKAGDSLGRIAQETGVPLETLQKLNEGNLTRSWLMPGQKLRIK
jgi:FtsZ-binding cell division protein ZapB